MEAPAAAAAIAVAQPERPPEPMAKHPMLAPGEHEFVMWCAEAFSRSGGFADVTPTEQVVCEDFETKLRDCAQHGGDNIYAERGTLYPSMQKFVRLALFLTGQQQMITVQWDPGVKLWFKPGTSFEGKYDGWWYPATVEKALPDGKFLLRWDEASWNDGDASERTQPKENIRLQEDYAAPTPTPTPPPGNVPMDPEEEQQHQEELRQPEPPPQEDPPTFCAWLCGRSRCLLRTPLLPRGQGVSTREQPADAESARG